jgi:2,3-bisphosphoglycerate-dependent phosphoglycerate mutase
MNPSLIFVRHSTPAIDPATPSTDWPLNVAGIEAAKRLASQLGSFNPIRLLSSPERKARETAEILGAAFGLNVHLKSDLQEHKRAIVGFLPLKDFESDIADLFRLPNDIAFGEESAIDVFARISATLPTPVCDDGPTIVVSHGTALSIYMSQAFGVDGFALWQSLKTPMAIVITPNGWALVDPDGSEAR